MEIRILLTRKFFNDDIDYLKKNLSSNCKLLIPENYSEDNLLKIAKDADIFLGNLISKNLCKAAPKLKFIQIPWTGVDNLNFEEIKEIGIPVCNSHSNAYAVAEHAIALMFDTAKKVAYHDAEMRRGNWNRPKLDKLNEVSPFSKRISNQKIGIIGYGHIGKTIHKYLFGFDCSFFIVDATVKQNYSEDKNHFFAINSLHEILAEIDYVFICVPLTEQTKSMVDDKFISALNSSAILINISRGEVIQEAALYNGLLNNDIKGAGLDTWYNYPKNPSELTMPSSYHFHELKNIVMSPHRSAFIEGELPHLDDAINNINRAAQGLEPLNIISFKNKY